MRTGELRTEVRRQDSPIAFALCVTLHHDLYQLLIYIHIKKAKQWKLYSITDHVSAREALKYARHEYPEITVLNVDRLTEE